ncbi:MAG: competence/damage-inducible protein A [Tissierellia bacterium]|nr:competence/damage-inducible protein A [Tissierellia bacterium]
MKAEIISVGTELILGDTLNTNSHYISRSLTENGIEVLFHTSVLDNKKLLKDVINIALNRVELLIFTGGLGPTNDDMTKEILSETLDLPLILNSEIEKNIEKYFKGTNRDMPKNNIKQAYLPKNSKYLKNEIGTAPGIYIKHQGKIIILLPGPPQEMKTMLDNYVIPLIKQEDIIKTKTINTVGIGESQLEMLLKDIIENETNVNIATYAKMGKVDIRLVTKGKNEKKIDAELYRVLKNIENRISEYIYSYDNLSIEEAVFNSLKEKNMKIAFCESCTGGLITSKFTKISGASQVLDRGIVTYSDNSKIEELNVNKLLIDKYSSVSEEVALAMAKGLLEKTNVDIALSTTGIAGPTGATENKPIGLVYIGIALKEQSFVVKSIFKGDRNTIQNRASTKAFDELRKILK